VLRLKDVCTYASTVEVGVALVASQAAAPVPWAVGGVGALAERAPASKIGVVAPAGGAVADVPDGPVEDERHREVSAPVRVDTVAVRGGQPVSLHQEHVPVCREVGVEDGVSLPVQFLHFSPF